MGELVDMLELIRKNDDSDDRGETKKLVMVAKEEPPTTLSAHINDMSSVLFGLVKKRKALALKAMLDAGSSPMAVNAEGSSMLMEAVKGGDVETASVLIQSGG